MFQTSCQPGLVAARSRRKTRGFTIVELVVVMAVGLIAAAITVPLVASSLQSFRLQAAVTSVSGIIQSTRYRAIVDGCPYAVAFSKAANTYQVSSAVTGGACAPTLTNVGPAVLFGNPSQIGLSQDVTFQFRPGSSVQVVSGAATFNLTYSGSSLAKTITVTQYGSVKAQ